MTSNAVGWFEIYVQDMTRAGQFYESVLQVRLENLPSPDGSPVEMRAFPMNPDRPGSSGALAKMDGFPSGGNSTLVYFSCEDCGVEAGRVVASGGRMQQEKTAIGEFGFIALAYDTEGNMFGLHSMS